MWTPTLTLLGTVKEFETFSYSITYLSEIGINLPVTITALVPKPSVVISGNSISGYYKFLFNDSITYKNISNTFTTLQGTETTGAWEIFDINDVYQMTSFKPDSTRFRTFSFLAEAKDGSQVVDTRTYTIDVDDKNWTPGLNNLKDAVTATKAKGG